MVSPQCTVTVIDSNSFVEAHANVSSQATVDECAWLLPILKESIFGMITAAYRTSTLVLRLDLCARILRLGLWMCHKSQKCTLLLSLQAHSFCAVMLTLRSAVDLRIVIMSGLEEVNFVKTSS